MAGTNWVPLQFLGLGKEPSPNGAAPGGAQTLLSSGGIENCPGPSGWCLMKQPEGSLGTCGGNHTHLAAPVGPVTVLLLVFSFAVIPFSKSAAQMHPPGNHSVLECSSEQEWFCDCVENWVGKSHTICNFSFPYNWTTEHHRNVGWKGCLEAPSSMSHSKQVWFQPRPGQPRLWSSSGTNSCLVLLLLPSVTTK